MYYTLVTMVFTRGLTNFYLSKELLLEILQSNIVYVSLYSSNPLYFQIGYKYYSNDDTSMTIKFLPSSFVNITNL